MSETTDHQALAQFLTIAEPRLPLLAFAWHTPNEGLGQAIQTKRGGRVPVDVLRGGLMGVRRGVWDWLYIGPNLAPILDKPPLTYWGLAIELKTARGALSDEQKVWGSHYQRNSWYTVVCREWTQAARLLVQWVGGCPEEFEGI